MDLGRDEIQRLLALEEDDENDIDYQPNDEEGEDEEEEEEEERRDEEEAASSTAEQSEDDRVLEDIISKRTRSKLWIEEAPDDALSNPDVEPDLYQPEDESEEWEDFRQFCSNLFNDNPSSNLLDDDEANDPDWDALKDVREVNDANEFLDVSRKEFNRILPPAVIATAHPEHSDWSSCLTSDHRSAIEEQLIQHVQLLTQTYLLTFQLPNLHSVASTSAKRLSEIHERSQISTLSICRTYNLSQAIEIVKKNPITVKEYPKRRKRPAISEDVITIFIQNPGVFSCESLLPRIGYLNIDNRMGKVQFTYAEDYLIALGVDQLKNHPDKEIKANYLRYLQNLMMPTKTLPQLRTHVKNLRARYEEGNPLCQYLKDGTLPPTEKRSCPLAAPTSYDPKGALPEWLKSAFASRRYCDVTKVHILPVSPFKQANSIIKKYKQLSRTPRTPTKVLILGKSDSSTPGKNPDSSSREVSESRERKDDSPFRESSDKGDNAELNDEDECENDIDDEFDLAALMMASSTINTNNKLRGKLPDNALGQKKEGKKSLQNKQKESTLKLLSEDWEESESEKASKDKVLADYFLAKARDVLKSDEDFISFLKCLSDFHEVRTSNQPSKSVKDLYVDIAVILRKCDADELLEEFVLFLTPQEAKECDLMFQYLHWQRFKSFIRKLEILSENDPQILARLHRALSQLKQNEVSIDKMKLKATVSRALNGHSYMMRQFSTLFLDEKPNENLFLSDHDFEEVEIPTSDEECANGEDSNFETVQIGLTEEEQKYGTNECPCTFCHQNLVLARDNQALTRHCISCSLRFVGGRVFLVQGHKKLQPAKVEILGAREERSASSQEQAEELTDSCDEQEPRRNAKRQRTSSSSDSSDPWSPDDDKILLQVMQAKIAENPTIVKEVFEELSKKLRRSEGAVASRFNLLMDILRENAKEDGSDSDQHKSD